MSVYPLPVTENDFNSSVNDWEKSDIPGLTKFDLERKPRQLLPNRVKVENSDELVANEISIPKHVLEKIFDNEFKCPICLGTVKLTSAVTACLHRFCCSCIEKVLRTTGTQHDCPSCRKKLASRRATKPDTNFDSLIKLLQYKKKLRDANGGDANNATSSTTGDGSDDDEVFDLEKYRKAYSNKKNEFKQQSFKLSQRPGFLSSGASDPNKRARNDDGTGSPRAEADPGKVLFSLFPLPEWRTDPRNQEHVQQLSNNNKVEVNSEDCTLKSPYLRVPYLLKIGDLKQYIKKKYLMSNDQFTLLEIVARHNEHDVVLDEYLTLRDVTLKYWDANSEFKLYFRLFSVDA